MVSGIEQSFLGGAARLPGNRATDHVVSTNSRCVYVFVVRPTLPGHMSFWAAAEATSVVGCYPAPSGRPAEPENTELVAEGLASATVNRLNWPDGLG
jgi:hypothetical protein